MRLLLLALPICSALVSLERYFPNHQQFALTEDIYEQLCRKEMERYVKNDERMQGIPDIPPVPAHYRHLVDDKMMAAQKRMSTCMQEVAKILYENRQSIWKAEMLLNMHKEEYVYMFWKCIKESQRTILLERYKTFKEREERFFSNEQRKATKEAEFIQTHPILRPPFMKFLDKLADGIKAIEKLSDFISDIPIIGQIYGPIIGDQITRLTTMASQMNEVIQNRASFGTAILNVAKQSATKVYERLTSEDSLL